MQAQGGQGANCQQMIKDWWNKLKFFNKALVQISVVIYLLTWIPIMQKIVSYLVNIPSNTIYHYWIWALITSTFIHINWMNLAFSLMSLLPTTMMLETQFGTLVQMIDFMVKSATIQIAYTLFAFILSLFSFNNLMLAPCYGYWNLVMTYITINCISNPEQETNFLCFPVKVKQKWYPILILVFILLLSGGGTDQIGALGISMILGYTEVKFFNGMFVRLSKERALRWEQKLFSSFIGSSDFVSANNNADQAYFAQQPNPQAAYQGQQQQNKNDRSTLQSYFGGKGVVLGSNPMDSLQQQHQERHESERILKNDIERAEQFHGSQQQAYNRLDQTKEDKGVELTKQTAKEVETKQKYDDFLDMSLEQQQQQEPIVQTDDQKKHLLEKQEEKNTILTILNQQ